MTGTARPSQPKPAPRAVPTQRCYYLGYTMAFNVCSVIFAIGGRRYEYTLTPQQIESVDYLCRKVSPLKGLNYAKRKGKPVTLCTAP